MSVESTTDGQTNETQSSANQLGGLHPWMVYHFIGVAIVEISLFV
jgi:hypothetical protein